MALQSVEDGTLVEFGVAWTDIEVDQQQSVDELSLIVEPFDGTGDL